MVSEKVEKSLGIFFFFVCIVFFGGSVLGADHKELLVLESAVEELKLNILWGLT